MQQPSHNSNDLPVANAASHHFRFHLPLGELFKVFGDDWFSLKAEAFVRFFGTPIFLMKPMHGIGRHLPRPAQSVNWAYCSRATN